MYVTSLILKTEVAYKLLAYTYSRDSYLKVNKKYTKNHTKINIRFV